MNTHRIFRSHLTLILAALLVVGLLGAEQEAAYSKSGAVVAKSSTSSATPKKVSRTPKKKGITRYSKRKSRTRTPTRREDSGVRSTETPTTQGGSVVLRSFFDLEQELLGAKAKKAYLAMEHYKRIEADLTALEEQGYPKEEIERLRTLAKDLSPHLRDQMRREKSVSSSATPIQPPSGGMNQGQRCISNPDPIFTADITKLNRISRITPPGVVTNAGELKSHSYLWIKDTGTVPVYAPVDAELTAGVHLPQAEKSDYGLAFQISCEVEFSLGHIVEPIESIRAAFPALPKAGDTRLDPISPIPFKAGDLLGYTSGTAQAHNWDFGVYNSTRPDPDAEAFGAAGKDARANCPYDYYPPEKRSVYRSLFSHDFGVGGTVRVAYCD